MTFQDLKLIEPIRRALKAEGYDKPTPIQQQAIPFALKGRDLLACAQTGTGKTAAFAVPILQQLHESKQNNQQRLIKALVVTPTRELAIQIGESFGSYGRYTGLRHTVIFGGVSQHQQVKTLRNGIDILVATPGRLLDLMNQGYISLADIEHFVLDEADRMLDMGFIHDIKRLLKKLPDQRQTLFFSATMPHTIQDLANSILTNPKMVEVTPASTTAENVGQYVYHVSKSDKRALLIHLLREESINSALVFTRTKHGANRVAQQLTRAGIEAQAIHGNKSQSARQKALSSFKKKQTRVLVATDIAARGIDVDELSHVINFDLPNVAETYVHRIGRTGRAGASGIALSFCNGEEKAYLKDIRKLTGQSIPVVEDHPYLASEAEMNATAPSKSNDRRGGSNQPRNGKRSGQRNSNRSRQRSNNR